MLAENLRRIREDRDWSMSQLANRARVHKAVIADIESGKTRMPAYDKLVRIARALGVHPDALCEPELLVPNREGAA